MFLPVDFEAYEAVSQQLMAVLREFSPVMEEAGIDEAFLDISELPGSPEEIARAVKQRIRARTHRPELLGRCGAACGAFRCQKRSGCWACCGPGRSAKSKIRRVTASRDAGFFDPDQHRRGTLRLG